MLDINPVQIQGLKSSGWNNMSCDVMRLDQFHPVVSGNKWFKLRHYIADAQKSGKDTIATFGGAYSNHIVATAFACKASGLQCIGVIRGEKPPHLSPSLEDALQVGMKLFFVSREAYTNRQLLIQQFAAENIYWIDEGGYGSKGMLGAKDILHAADTSNYSHIICACGTGTTLSGLVAAALPSQLCIGISVLKGHENLAQNVMKLLPGTHQETLFQVFHDYHFGGYAKHPPQLIAWMNELWRSEQVPTDIVYTAKLMYAVKDLATKNYFDHTNKILIIHSGGLQGNRSLPAGTLEFL
jgi:1-aminocyclopropane-1-carboxylate deaminase